MYTVAERNARVVTLHSGGHPEFYGRQLKIALLTEFGMRPTVQKGITLSKIEKMIVSAMIIDRSKSK
jgi:hypothetical protein